MPTESDRQFVILAIARGFLPAEKGREVLVRLRQAERNQAQLSIERLLVLEEFLAQEQVAELQEAMRRKLMYCLCGQKMNIFPFDPGTRVKCKSCNRIFEVPE